MIIERNKVPVGYPTTHVDVGLLSTLRTTDEGVPAQVTPWMVAFTLPTTSIEHKVGGTSILRLIRRTQTAMKTIPGIQTEQPDRRMLVFTNQVLNLGQQSKYQPCRRTL